MNEFAINWLKGSDYAEITVPSGSALKSKLLKYAAAFPEEVNHVIENKDGSMVCHVPVRYVKVTRPRVVSDAQKEAVRKRAKAMWAKKRGLDADSISDAELDEAMELVEEMETEAEADDTEMENAESVED